MNLKVFHYTEMPPVVGMTVQSHQYKHFLLLFFKQALNRGILHFLILHKHFLAGCNVE